MIFPILTIVVPCYNEEEILPETISELHNLMIDMVNDKQISNKSKLLLVDDGSKDQTWQIIYREGLRREMVRGLKLSRNAGHQNALLAGLFTAKEFSDCVLTIDADLQDDIRVIPEFIEEFTKGNEIVYGVRKCRKNDSFFKRSSAQGFYKFMKLLGVDLVYNHADFRLMSSRAIGELERFTEVNLFLRGIVPLIGLNSSIVYYERLERKAGESKYPLKKMLTFAFDGITSFSVTPIRAVLLMGMLSFLGSMMFGTYFLILKFLGQTETGWTSMITSIWLIGGLQLISIGLIGEYIGKIYKESKQRPKYSIDIDTYQLGRPGALRKNTVIEEEWLRLEETRNASQN